MALIGPVLQICLMNLIFIYYPIVAHAALKHHSVCTLWSCAPCSCSLVAEEWESFGSCYTKSTAGNIVTSTKCQSDVNIIPYCVCYWRRIIQSIAFFSSEPKLEFSQRLWGHATGSVGIALWAEMSLLTRCCCSHYKRSSETAAALLPLESCDNNCVCGFCVCVCVRVRSWANTVWVWEREERTIKPAFYYLCQ